MIRVLLLTAALFAGVIPQMSWAQPATEVAKAEGKAFGRDKAATAQSAATTKPDAGRIPNFADGSPQARYFDAPKTIEGAAAAAATSHDGYRAIRSSMDNRARFDPVDLDATIARSQAVSADPLAYTSGMTVGGTQGRCVPLPSAAGGTGRYFATCNRGVTATTETRGCAITLTTSTVRSTDYIYWCNDAPLNRVNRVDDCALLRDATCRETGTHPGRCLQFSVDQSGRRYCSEPGEPIAVMTCSTQVDGATLKDSVPSVSVTTARDESACAILAADSDCTRDAERCTDSDPVTRTIDGIAVTQPCWAWQRSYSCSTVTSAQDCSALDATPGCTFVREDCLTDDEPCRTWERIYDCPVPDAPPSPNQFICDGDIYCIDGSCETIEREANDEFKDAVVALEGMAQARREFDPDTLTLFKGERGTCSSKVFGVLNCCKGKGFPLIPGIGLLVALGCNPQEVLLHQRDAQGLCAYIGSYCSDDVLGVCLTKKKVYCCFESKLSRILQEQGRRQIDRPWAKPKREQCAGFTIDEFARLDLSAMNFSEVYAEFTEAARLPDELEAAADIQQKIEDFYAAHSN